MIPWLRDKFFWSLREWYLYLTFLPHLLSRFALLYAKDCPTSAQSHTRQDEVCSRHRPLLCQRPGRTSRGAPGGSRQVYLLPNPDSTLRDLRSVRRPRQSHLVRRHPRQPNRPPRPKDRCCHRLPHSLHHPGFKREHRPNPRSRPEDPRPHGLLLRHSPRCRWLYLRGER